MDKEYIIAMLVELRELISLLMSAESGYRDNIGKLIDLYFNIAKSNLIFELPKTKIDLLTGELS